MCILYATICGEKPEPTKADLERLESDPATKRADKMTTEMMKDLTEDQLWDLFVSICDKTNK